MTLEALVEIISFGTKVLPNSLVKIGQNSSKFQPTFGNLKFGRIGLFRLVKGTFHPDMV